jgi:NDP-sugar pyrophosphorylase family protein
MINIVIPMAGRGSRFASAGFELPKPLIDVMGKPMIDWVIDNIAPKELHRFIFLCLQEHLDKYSLENHLKSKAENCVIVPVNEVTEGAACTVLLAERYIDNDSPLMIANSDQYVDVSIDEYMYSMGKNDGLIMTMKATDDKWSFIKYDENGFVTIVREKEVISDEATVGIYNFARGAEFVKYAHDMIEKNIKVNNEFYVAPVYNMMIEDKKKIGFYNVGKVDNGMYGLGTPSDLKRFLEIYASLNEMRT